MKRRGASRQQILEARKRKLTRRIARGRGDTAGAKRRLAKVEKRMAKLGFGAIADEVVEDMFGSIW